MSWFSNVNINDIPDNPYQLPDDTYLFEVTSAKFGETKDNTKLGITFKYQIVKGPWKNFYAISDWTRVPDPNVPQDEAQRMLSFLKMRLLAFGFSLEEIQNFGEDSLPRCIGRTFYGTTSCKKQEDGTSNIRVTHFKPVSEGVSSNIDWPDEEF